MNFEQTYIQYLYITNRHIIVKIEIRFGKEFKKIPNLIFVVPTTKEIFKDNNNGNSFSM